MPGLLIIAHAPLASSLKAVAQHTFPEAAAAIQTLDVTPDMAPGEIEAQARALLRRMGSTDAVIFTDVFGATPCNVAQRLADGVHVKVLTGVNVPMLWRTLCYGGDSAEALVARALAGGNQGIMQAAAAQRQNQAVKHGNHDQDDHHHQQ